MEINYSSCMVLFCGMYACSYVVIHWIGRIPIIGSFYVMGFSLVVLTSTVGCLVYLIGPMSGLFWMTLGALCPFLWDGIKKRQQGQLSILDLVVFLWEWCKVLFWGVMYVGIKVWQLIKLISFVLWRCAQCFRHSFKADRSVRKGNLKLLGEEVVRGMKWLVGRGSNSIPSYTNSSKSVNYWDQAISEGRREASRRLSEGNSIAEIFEPKSSLNTNVRSKVGEVPDDPLTPEYYEHFSRGFEEAGWISDSSDEYQRFSDDDPYEVLALTPYADKGLLEDIYLIEKKKYAQWTKIGVSLAVKRRAERILAAIEEAYKQLKKKLS